MCAFYMKVYGGVGGGGDGDCAEEETEPITYEMKYEELTTEIRWINRRYSIRGFSYSTFILYSILARPYNICTHLSNYAEKAMCAQIQ